MTLEATRPLNEVDLEAVGGLAQAVADEPANGATIWSASVEWKGAFRSEARIRDFEALPSDEPTALGGTDTAPNPVEQLLAALGNCLAVGYAANASAAGIELSQLRIDVSGDLDLASFLGVRPGHAGFSGITAAVHLEADAPDEAIAGLHETVIGSSPVGHTLGAEIPVSITLA